MLKPVMHKHFIAIILCLLCLLVSHPAEARLTLGVVIGPDDAAGEVTSAQAISLASLLAEELDEEVVVKELADSATLVDWLDRFAMLDLALLSSKEVKANPGKFLQIEPFDKQDKFNLVARQGVAGDLPQRINAIVRESDFAVRDAVETVAPPVEQSPEESPFPVESEPTSIDEVIASKVELQQVPPLGPGRAWTPQEEGTYRDILPVDEPSAKKLVLGVFPDPGGLVRTSQQAEQLANYLEQVLPISVKVREFTSIEAFAEWFMRYRMVDLAVLSPDIAKANLGRDYLPVAKLFRVDKPGLESAELFVMRRGQNEELQARLQRALLDIEQTSNGQSLMAAFKVSEVIAPDGVFVQPPVVDQEPEPVIIAEEPPLDLIEESLVELLPPVKYTDPVEPVTPPEVIVALPAFPQIVEPISPSDVESVKAPDLPEKLLAPLLPETPPVLTVEVPVITPEYADPVEPVAPSEVADKELPELPEIAEPVAMLPLPAIDVPTSPVEPVEMTPPQIPEEPAIVAAPPMPQEEVVQDSEKVPAAPATPPAFEEEVVQDSVVLPEMEQPETVVAADIVPGELTPPVVAPTEPEIEDELVVGEESFEDKEQEIIEEVLTPADVEHFQKSAEPVPVIVDQTTESWSDEEFAEMLNEDMVAAVVAQPDIPQELRPLGIPVVRPGRIARRTTAVEDELLLASIPEPRKNVEPSRPPTLLPQPEPEPGVIYIVPFVAVMVPDEFNARVFDQFVDTLIREGTALGLQFVILKEGLQRVSPEWLAIRKYVTGEIYAYVEDSGCCSTDLRTKAGLTYRRPNQNVPAFSFEYPVKSFFDHDRSTLDAERVKLADDIAATLAAELLKALQS